MTKVENFDFNDTEFIEDFKQFILNNLFEYERQAFIEGLELLGFSFNDYFITSVKMLRLEDDKPQLDTLSLPQNEIVKRLERLDEELTEDKKEKLQRFNKVLFKVRYIFMQYLIRDKEYEKAIAYADFALDGFAKLKDRIDEQLPAIIDEYIDKIKAERELLIVQINLPKTVDIKHEIIDNIPKANNPKIRWIKSKEELIEKITDTHIKAALIIKKPSISYEQLSFSCFYIDGCPTDSDELLSFMQGEKLMLSFFDGLIQSQSIDFSELTKELLVKICKYCLNKKGKPYNVRQLQTVIKTIGEFPRKTS